MLVTIRRKYVDKHTVDKMASKSIFRAQIPIRVKGSVSCAHHRGFEVSLCCRQCSELACIRCIASVHDRHVLDDLSEVITTKKGNIQSFIVRTETSDITDLKTEVSSVSKKIYENERKFQKHLNELEKQGTRIKEEIDIIIKKSVSRCSEIKRENERRLRQYKTDIEKSIDNLTELVEKCRSTIETGDVVEIFDMEKEVDVLPIVELNLCSMTFTPNQHPQGYLDLAMGRLASDWNVLMNTCDNEDSLRDSQTETSRHLVEVNEVKAPYNVTAICANKDEGAWICSGEATSIYQLDNCMSIDEKIRCKVRINDISISPVTGNVWASSEDNNAIMEITSQGNPVKRFSTFSAPRCLCLTRGSKIVVGMDRELVRCDVLGEGSQLNSNVRKPTKVAACPVTENIAVVDLDSYTHGGEGKPHILVFDQAFKEYFRFYNEQDARTNQTTPDSFCPSDITFDCAGNLLIGDHDNKSILILNTTGAVVRSIYKDSWHVVALGINNKDSVWAVVRYRDYPNYKIKLLRPEYDY
ncbi:uncharacterized protein [Argopecten irradians]|uniref:uncharacterized protein n=1 Tax=Argopecten irradians TaxID=31199 RepID=UPI003711AFB1